SHASQTPAGAKHVRSPVVMRSRKLFAATVFYLAVKTCRGLLSCSCSNYVEIDLPRQPPMKGPSMKTQVLFGAMIVLTGPLLSADSSPKDDVLAAAKKLGDQPNYSWRTTVAVPESAQFKPGPTEGRTEKDGYTHLTMSIRDNTTQAFI